MNSTAQNQRHVWHSPLFLAALVVTLFWTVTSLIGLPPRPGMLRTVMNSVFSPRKAGLDYGFLGSYLYAARTAVSTQLLRDLHLRPEPLTVVLEGLIGLEPSASGEGTSPSGSLPSLGVEWEGLVTSTGHFGYLGSPGGRLMDEVRTG